MQAIEAKLKAADKTGSKKVLLDLRDVASGDMSEATRLANFFLRTGTIATLEGQKVEKVTYTADPRRRFDPSAPMVVLVNRGTAGPGELVAAALLDDKRAELVGEKTFGEGAQQQAVRAAGRRGTDPVGREVRHAGGKKLQDDGVTPGVLVAGNIPDQDGATGDDDRATPHATPTPAKPSVQWTTSLTKALELLKAKSA